MPVEFICDGCGKREKGSFNRYGNALKPSKWFKRTVDGVTQVACSEECIEKLGGLVAPW